MSLWDGLIAFAVVGGIFAVVLAKVLKNNPGAKEWLQNLVGNKPKEEIVTMKDGMPVPKEFLQQLYPGRSSDL